MGSLHFILTRIGTMNLVAAEVRRRILGMHDSVRLVTSAATNRRFIESFLYQKELLMGSSCEASLAAWARTAPKSRASWLLIIPRTSRN